MESELIHGTNAIKYSIIKIMMRGWYVVNGIYDPLENLILGIQKKMMSFTSSYLICYNHFVEKQADLYNNRIKEENVFLLFRIRRTINLIDVNADFNQDIRHLIFRFNFKSQKSNLPHAFS